MTSPSSLPPVSSPPPSPSPPFRPFSRLPTELVQHIIESTAPLNLYSSTYSERQTTLRSLSLVSRLFRHIAQPILCGVARFEDETFSLDPWRLVNNAPQTEPSRSLLALSIVACRFDLHNPVFASLRLLVIKSAQEDLDMAQVAGLVNLNTLRLANVNIVASTVYEMLNLAELQILDVAAKPSVDQVINRAQLPSLRIFTACVQDFPRSEVEAMLLSLEPQLESLSLDHRILNNVSIELIHQINPKTLFDATAFNYFISDAQYVRIIKGGDPGPRALSLGDLTRLEQLLRTTIAPGPELIYLPPISSLEHEHSAELLVKKRELEETADDREIEIVYEEQPPDWAADSGFSIDFWRRVKVQKGEKIRRR